MSNQTRKTRTDLSDLTGHAHTYLMNGARTDGKWTGQFRPGEQVRLRDVNPSAQSTFDHPISELQHTVIATDVQDVRPVTVNRTSSFSRR